jgi:hypothetical protein
MQVVECLGNQQPYRFTDPDAFLGCNSPQCVANLIASQRGRIAAERQDSERLPAAMTAPDGGNGDRGC